VRPAVLLAALALATTAAAADGPEEQRAAVERERLQQRAAVEQKLKLADSMINRSAGARRVGASGNQEALRLLAEARAAFAGSRAALDAGNLGAADELAAESLRQLRLAVRLVPESGAVEAEQARARYARLLGAVQTFQASQIHSAGRAAVTQPEMERVRELVRRAQEAAGMTDFSEASRTLDQAAAVVLESAPRLLATAGASTGGTGTAALAAASARYQSYEDLAGIVVARANVAPERERALQAAVERARGLNIRAQDLGLSNRDDEAMTAVQEAITVVREALRAAGVISLQ
jgi:hypothetical protein